MPPFPPTLDSEVLGRGAAALGLGTLPVPLLVNTTPWGGRAACVRCARCVGFACPVDAKTGTHQTALPDALATGLAQLVLGARAERITTDAAGRVTGVALVGDLEGSTWRREVRAGDVVVAAGAVESARLLLSSTSDREPHGLGNDRDQVGRHLQGHDYGGATAVFDDVVVDLLGPGPSIATSDHRHGVEGLVGGGMLANEFVPTPASAFRTLADAGLVPLHGRGSLDGMRQLAPRLMKVMGPAQEVTTGSSRVRLSRLRDAHGSQVAHLEGDLHGEDVRTQAFLSARAAEWLTASGARQVVEAGRLTPSAGPSAGQHQAGTCRMGDDPATSVVDRDGLVWGHDNLRVVDGSTHVTNGGVNPVLTIMANALRMTAAMTG
jgi:choline dehydrogenase-like flavoprotein